MITFTKRNLLLYFRDKGAVLSSLLSVFIVIGLYAFFLGDNLVNSFKTSGIAEGDAKQLVNTWLMAGILAIVPLTTTLTSYGTMVLDVDKKIYKDFRCAPIRRSALAGGYIVSAFIIGTIMSLVTLLLAEIYIVMCGGEFLSAVNLLKVIGVILLNILASSAMMYFLVSFVKSVSAFSAIGTIVGVLVGFITGVYIPITAMPEAAAYVVKIFPISHSASLFRQIFMEDAMENTFSSLPDAVRDSVETEITDGLGVTFTIGSWEVSTLDSMLILIATALLFYILGVLVVTRKKR